MRKHARNSFVTNEVEQVDLPPDTLAAWLRIGHSERIAVSSTVPLGAVAGVVRHLRSHASDRLAEAMGLTKCLADECETARSWLPPVKVCAKSAV